MSDAETVSAIHPVKVRVFRNLTRRCYSVQMRTTGKGWRTVAHAREVLVSGAVFTVSDAGRRRVVATGKKAVHAWIEGDLAAWRGELAPNPPNNAVTRPLVLTWNIEPVRREGWEWASYNPTKDTSFVRLVVPGKESTVERHPISCADLCTCAPDGLRVLNPS